MSTRPRLKRERIDAETNHADKGFEEVAERIFRDDSPAEPLFAILGEPSEEVA
ncbi:MAG: hypothetical protein HYX28_06005 [Candidatus Koribacter versatilis]|uniref:Uncharacterized protein n=1 Tax=Candidatus Korobacter versatilis TaxID=658062 RepID=A0A932EP03_9BACT|nr:hypothetical protein [Candidatus Koribacter versatilis]